MKNTLGACTTLEILGRKKAIFDKNLRILKEDRDAFDTIYSNNTVINAILISIDAKSKIISNIERYEPITAF